MLNNIVTYKMKNYLYFIVKSKLWKYIKQR